MKYEELTLFVCKRIRDSFVTILLVSQPLKVAVIATIHLAFNWRLE